LAAAEAGQEVLVIEADAVASGSTALSAGLIPAAGTLMQRAAGIADSAAQFAANILDKAKRENDPAIVWAMAAGAGPAIDWLSEAHGLPSSVVTDFAYPGHSHHRMHGLPTRAGAELIDALRLLCEAQGIDIVCGLRAEALFAKGRLVTGGHRGSGGWVDRDHLLSQADPCLQWVWGQSGDGLGPYARHQRRALVWA
jgi:fumarate reductase flavoprotein subunit